MASGSQTVVIKALAANLGVTTDKLQSAIKQTMLQQIDENEKSGKLTADLYLVTVRDGRLWLVGALRRHRCGADGTGHRNAGVGG